VCRDVGGARGPLPCGLTQGHCSSSSLSRSRPRRPPTSVATKGSRFGVGLGVGQNNPASSKKGYEYEPQSRAGGGRANSKASRSSPIRLSPNLIAGFRQKGRDAARFRRGLFCPFRAILLSAREASTDGSEGEGGGGGPRRWKWNAPMRKFQDSIKALQADIDHANAM
jgi:hypothetical protein